MRPEEKKMRTQLERGVQPAFEHLHNLNGVCHELNQCPVDWAYVERRLGALIDQLQMLRDLVKNFRDEQAQKGGPSS